MVLPADRCWRQVLYASPLRRRRTAIHEAEHAVVGRVFGLDCGAVTIVANHAEMEAGHAITADPAVTLYRWDRIGRFRGHLPMDQDGIGSC